MPTGDRRYLSLDHPHPGISLFDNVVDIRVNSKVRLCLFEYQQETCDVKNQRIIEPNRP